MTHPYPTVALRRLAARVRQDAAAGESGVPSPCVSICRMDDDRRYCLGCLRTIDEIAAWSRMDDAARREVWSRIEQRLEASA